VQGSQTRADEAVSFGGGEERREHRRTAGVRPGRGRAVGLEDACTGVGVEEEKRFRRGETTLGCSSIRCRACESAGTTRLAGLRASVGVLSGRTVAGSDAEGDDWKQNEQEGRKEEGMVSRPKAA
jgi:hypothetical protein